MGLRNFLKKRIEDVTGSIILKSLPFGIDPIQDINLKLNNYSIDTVVDVGANIGQTAISLRKKLPEAVIFCIEPSKKMYIELTRNMEDEKNVYTYNVAFGESNSELDFYEGQKNATMSSFVNTDTDEKTTDKPVSYKVLVKTLDEFSTEHSIQHINYLKIDTEGYDLDVLKGSVGMISHNSIDFIEVEAGMSPRNNFHVPFETLKQFLEEQGYLIFGIYDQTQEWIDKKPYLRRCNALYISSNLAHNFKS